MNHSRKTVYLLTLSAMFAALITVATVYVLHIHLSLSGGHNCLHVGDTVLYLAASILPAGYACAASAIGSSLANLLCGSVVYAPWTFIIKALVALCFTADGSKLLVKRNYIALSGACLVTVLGYYMTDVVLLNNWLTPLYAAIGNTLQCIVSSILYLVIGFMLDKIQIKKQIHLQ